MQNNTIKIGTRGSRLALWQAYYVEKRLQAKGFPTEIVIIETRGDKILDRTLAKIGSKGVFTEELEDQLRDGRIDLAVHSAKDLQSHLHENFRILAFTPRETVNDVLVSHTPEIDLNSGKSYVLGTSSVRRVALLRHYFPHLQTVNIRGNLQTRMRKMEEGACHALVLAFAGVHRMEYTEMIRHHFPIDPFTPPVGQGTVAVESLAELNPDLEKAIREALNHEETEWQLKAERAFLHRLEGGCSIPAFAHATISMADQTISISGGLIHPKGNPMIRASVQSKLADAPLAGRQLAEKILQNGGQELLSEIRGEG